MIKYPEIKKISVSSLTNPEKYCGKVRYIEIKSSWEVSFYKYLDANPNVMKWSSEDIVIMYKHPDGRTHRYFPDAYIKFKNFKGQERECIVEIKPYKETIKPVFTKGMKEKTKRYLVETYAMNTAKWTAAKKYCHKRNMRFHILTEKDIYFQNKDK